jgi:hypothetical protein
MARRVIKNKFFYFIQFGVSHSCVLIMVPLSV